MIQGGWREQFFKFFEKKEEKERKKKLNKNWEKTKKLNKRKKKLNKNWEKTKKLNKTFQTREEEKKNSLSFFIFITSYCYYMYIYYLIELNGDRPPLNCVEMGGGNQIRLN